MKGRRWSGWPTSTPEKHYKKGNFANFANFFVKFARSSGLELVGLEDSTAPYESAKRMDLFEVGQVGQLQYLRNATKKGSWPTLPT